MDIAFQSASELAAALRKKEVGSLELLDHYLERVDRLNPKINAVVTLDVERARRRAKEADDALARGEVLGPLHGLPMTIKDSFETEGIRTTSGSPMLAEYVPARDAVAVARLKAAGAVIFGKTNLPLFAADVQSYNEVFGTTNNPWDPGRIPGGSSGGAAAALSAGLAGFELGSDIGGSIRNPAHFCGVFGHKPSYGVVPLRGHIPGPPGTLSEADIAVAGPLGRSADDLDLGLEVLAGPDDWRGLAWRLKLPPTRRRSLGKYQIAAWINDPHCPVDGEVVEVFTAAIKALRQAGAQIDEQARPAVTMSEASRVFDALLAAAVSAGIPTEVFEGFVALSAQGPPDERDRNAVFARNATTRHRDWLVINEQRQRQRAAWAQFFRENDVLLCPVTSTAAFPHDHRDFSERRLVINGEEHSYWPGNTWWAGIIGAAYLPSTVAPIGRTRSGLPVGVQVVSGYLKDRTCIDAARRITEVVGGYETPAGF